MRYTKQDGQPSPAGFRRKKGEGGARRGDAGAQRSRRLAAPGAAGKRSVSALAQTTKRALAASFKELLAQKPFNKITISDITEHCGVNRMTFYYHFHDIYDLAQWAFEEETAELLNGSLSAASWKEGFVMVARQLEENQVLLANICRSVPRRELEQRMKGLVQRLLDPILKRELGDAAVDPQDWEFTVHFYIDAMVGVLLEWMDGGMKTEPKILAWRLDILCGGGIRQAVEGFRTKM